MTTFIKRVLSKNTLISLVLRTHLRLESPVEVGQQVAIKRNNSLACLNQSRRSSELAVAL